MMMHAFLRQYSITRHVVIAQRVLLYGFSTTNQRRDECLLTHCAQTEQSSRGARRRAEGRDGGEAGRRGGGRVRMHCGGAAVRTTEATRAKGREIDGVE